jgi:hypothetical protein
MMTSDSDPTLERISLRIAIPEPAYERMLRRRDRKHLNQRFAAGSVGMVFLLAAVWIVTTMGLFDRTQTPVVPGGAGTGPAVTGPAVTGPAVTGPAVTGPAVTGPAVTGPAVTGPAVTSASEWDGHGLPPEGTALSTPAEGQRIAREDYEMCPGGCSKWYHTYLIVYADGRVLWWNDLRVPGGGDYVQERRLTPEGVDLVRSGVDPDDLPNSAWEDASSRPYAPRRYSVCFWANGVRDPSANPMLPAVDLLPPPAKALLDGVDPDPLHPGCLVVSTSEARALYDILSGEDLEAASDVSGGMTPGDTVGSWLLRGAEGTLGQQVGIYLRPLWPDGDWHQQCCA